MSAPPPRVAVIGASGFVGTATCAALERRGAAVLRVRAPRVTVLDVPSSAQVRARFATEVEALAAQLAGCVAVINCAGQPDASSRDQGALLGANAVVPGIAAAATRRAGGARFVQVSSAVVQGRARCLDDSMKTDAFSAYASSKIAGEDLALGLGPDETVIYRPPSVHAPSRRVTRMTARIARSRLACVAAPGMSNSPQAHIANVGDVTAFLALHPQTPPPVVIHPSEGVTTAGLLRTLGGHQPLLVPRPAALAVVTVAAALGRRIPAVAANARRVEMLWFGQEQAPSWVSAQGWVPVAGADAWQQLAAELRADQAR